MKFYIHQTTLRGNRLWGYTRDEAGKALEGSRESGTNKPVVWKYGTDFEIDGDTAAQLSAAITEGDGKFVAEAPPPAQAWLQGMTNDPERRRATEEKVVEELRPFAASMGIELGKFTTEDITVGEASAPAREAETGERLSAKLAQKPKGID